MMAFFHIKTPLSFVYLFELSQSKHKSIACSLVNLGDAFPLIVGGVFFKYISTNVDTLLLIMTTAHLVALIVVTLILPESPKWLLVTG